MNSSIDPNPKPDPVRLPRNFVEEVEVELGLAQQRLGAEHERVVQLQALYRVSVAVEASLGRQITVFDVIRSAPGRGERQRRQRLVRALRIATSSEGEVP
jgi:hypothetical protein